MGFSDVKRPSVDDDRGLGPDGPQDRLTSDEVPEIHGRGVRREEETAPDEPVLEMDLGLPAGLDTEGGLE